MKISFRSALILVFVFPAILPLRADEDEWFQQHAPENYSAPGAGFTAGRVILEFSAGPGKVDLSNAAVSRSEMEPWTDYHIIINSTNPLRRAVSLTKIVREKQPRNTGRTGRLAAEYALFDFLGLGISYSRSIIRTENLRVDSLEENDIFFLFHIGSGFTNPSDINADPGIHDLLDLRGRELVYREVQGLDFELGIHPLNGVYDPYVKLAFGLNIIDSGLDYDGASGGIISRNRSRFGILAGLRIFVTSGFVFNMELFGYDYPDNFLNRKIAASLHDEYGIRVGLGLAF